jgi:putative NADH-flavin reductase
MKLIIFGASGRTGHQLVRHALDAGHKVTGFVRDPSKMSISHPDLNLICGKITDADFVNQSLNGHEVVFSALGAASPFKFDQDVIDGFSNIIKGMKSNEIQRLIYESFAGVSESRNSTGFIIRNVAPILLKTEIQGHELREQMIRDSSLQWTIVRPVTLTNSTKEKKYRFGERINGNGFANTISRSDVAQFMLQQIDDKNFVQRAPMIMY